LPAHRSPPDCKNSIGNTIISLLFLSGEPDIRLCLPFHDTDRAAVPWLRADKGRPAFAERRFGRQFADEPHAVVHTGLLYFDHRQKKERSG
jgi:hypothetical protein